MKSHLTSEQFNSAFEPISSEAEEKIMGGEAPIRGEGSWSSGEYSSKYEYSYHTAQSGVTHGKYSSTFTSPYGSSTYRSMSIYNPKNGKYIYHFKSS